MTKPKDPLEELLDHSRQFKALEKLFARTAAEGDRNNYIMAAVCSGLAKASEDLALAFGARKATAPPAKKERRRRHQKPPVAMVKEVEP